MIVQLEEATQYYYYRAVLAIFPLTPHYKMMTLLLPNNTIEALK